MTARPPSEPGRPEDPAERADEEVTILQFVSLLLKYRYTIVGTSIGLAVVVVVVSLLTPRTYTARGSFIPQTVESRSGVAASLAGQLGVNLPVGSSNPTESPAFYSDLLRSREILEQVLSDTFAIADADAGDVGRTSGTLLELMEIEAGSEARRREEGLNRLRELVATSVASETGLVRVSVKMPWPNVARAVACRLLDLVSDFNRATRQTQAAAERSFLEARLTEADDSLRASEVQMRRFLEANRGFQNSPRLIFEHDRIEREVIMRQQLLTSLNQSYENARIAEVRNTPLITIVETPQAPVTPDARGTVAKGLVALLLGALAGALVGVVREFLGRRKDQEADDYRAFQDVWDETTGDLKKIVPGMQRTP